MDDRTVCNQGREFFDVKAYHCLLISSHFFLRTGIYIIEKMVRGEASMGNEKSGNKSALRVHGRNTLILVWLLTAMVMCVGCTIFKDSKNGDSLLYDICDESMLPDELMAIIDSKKEDKFNLVYSNNTYTYIVMAAGRQDRDDVGVEIEKMYKDKNAIYIKSILRQIATPGDTVVGDGISFPYTVIRIQRTEMPVIFK